MVPQFCHSCKTNSPVFCALGPRARRENPEVPCLDAPEIGAHADGARSTGTPPSRAGVLGIDRPWSVPETEGKFRPSTVYLHVQERAGKNAILTLFGGFIMNLKWAAACQNLVGACPSWSGLSFKPKTMQIGPELVELRPKRPMARSMLIGIKPPSKGQGQLAKGH